MGTTSYLLILARCLFAAAVMWPSVCLAQGNSFRAGTLVVPVDVRVVDSRNRPIEGLVKDDFVVREDGVPQPIVEFVAESDRPGRPSVGASSKPEERPGRVFLIDANRNWLGTFSPSFGITDALVGFIREKLSPEDRVGFAARGFATDITTNHEAVVEVIRRYESFLRSVYKRDAVRLTIRLERIRFEPPDSPLRVALEEVFAPATARARTSKRSVAEFDGFLSQVLREGADATMRQHQLMADPLAGQTIGKLQQAYARELLSAIRTVKDLEGEKHVISLGAIVLTNVASEREIADIANAGRVSLHVIRWNDPGFALVEHDQSIRSLTESTGGLAFLEREPADALRQIDAVSRSVYRVAYAAPSSLLDGRTHTITVQLRKGIKGTVVARRSYVASKVVSDETLAAAAMRDIVRQTLANPREASQIPVTARASAISTNGLDIHANLKLDQGLARRDDTFVGKFELAVFGLDKSGRVLNQEWRTLSLNLKQPAYDRVVADGLDQSVSLSFKERPASVRVIVFDYSTEVVGSAIVVVK